MVTFQEITNKKKKNQRNNRKTVVVHQAPNRSNGAYKVRKEIEQLRREVKQKKNKVKGTNKGKSLICKGVDFVRQVEVFPPQMLEGNPVTGIKLVAKYDISPSSFPNTRLELISNTYQLYRFTKLSISYTSILPTAVNGMFIAYIDTDPNEQEVKLSTNDVMRLARSHQGSVQGKIKDSWVVNMPERSDDQFFFIGDQGDIRFRKMGTLYIYQVGQATKFDGTPLEFELAAGTLNVHWTCEFNNPQLSPLVRIYDGVSEKDVLRIFTNMSWYRRLSAGNISSTAHLTGTPYRQANFVCNKDLFNASGIGDYRIVLMPLQLSISNTVKHLNTFALDYDLGQYQVGGSGGTDLFTLLGSAKVTAKQIIGFIKEAYKIAKGGIAIAKEVYDVIQVVSSAFLASQSTGANILSTIEDPSDSNIDNSDESRPIGSVVVHYDGETSPFIQTMVEYIDEAHAMDASTNFTYDVLAIAYKLSPKNASTPDSTEAGNPQIKPSLPFLLKL